MTTLLKPGILVSLKTTIRGGVTYARRDIEEQRTDETERKRWETERTITDVEEHDRAVKTRSAIGSAIRAHCVPTAFGLVCVVANEEELDAEIVRQQECALAWNRAAKCSQIGVYVLKGRIAETDEQATRAIADEIAGLLASMESGIAALDVTSVRDAANRARQMSRMLEGPQSERLGSAIDAARDAARTIQRRAIKGSEAAAVVLADLQTSPIERARFAFIEMAGESAGAALPSVNVQRFADLSESDAPSSATTIERPQLDFGDEQTIDEREREAERAASDEQREREAAEQREREYLAEMEERAGSM